MLLALVVLVALAPPGLSKMEALTGAEIDTLVALVERGPLHDGGIPSKVGRNGLIALGFAAQIVAYQDYMQYAATNKGLEWYLNYFKADNIKDGRINRVTSIPLP